MSDPRSGRRKVTLGDVALNSTKVSEEPAVEGFERYVIGKHISADSHRVTTWNQVGDGDFGPRIRTIFEPGDVVCTTRGPKLKVVTVDFKGLCAHTNFVLRTLNPDVLMQPYLEAVVRSDGFQRHLRANFRGSVNLFVNWSDAAKYEFELPPLREQHALVVLFQASAAQLEAAQRLITTSECAEQAEVQHWFRHKAQWPSVRIDAAGSVQLGQQKHPKYEAGLAPRPYLRVVNVTDGYLDLSEVSKMDFVGKDFEKHRLLPGDVLVTEGDLIGPRTVGRCAMFRGEISDCCVQKTLLRFRPGPSLVPGYVLWAFRHLRYAGVFAKASTGTTVAHLVAERFKQVQLPVAPASIQREIASSVDGWREIRSANTMHLRRAEAMHRAVLQDVRGPRDVL